MATRTRPRIMQFALVALLAVAAGAATVAYGGAITRLFVGAEMASEHQAPIPMRPEAPAVALPRGETSQSNGYWDYVRPDVPSRSPAREVQEQAKSNGYWDYVRPDTDCASACASPICGTTWSAYQPVP